MHPEAWELFFDANYNKNESGKPYLGNKEQKLLFLVVFQSDVHIGFDFTRPFFACRINLRTLKIGPVETNLSSPVYCTFIVILNKDFQSLFDFLKVNTDKNFKDQDYKRLLFQSKTANDEYTKPWFKRKRRGWI